MSTSNGHSADVDIDTLYSWWPGATPAPQLCPEALFSLTLRGTLDGVETLLTVRGMSSEEFQANLRAVRGLLDPVIGIPITPQPAPSQGEGWCSTHGLQMKWNEGKEGRKGWWSHKTADGWCKGK
jgi:hypothetical protein